jgi:hypothetical protein
MSTWVVRFGNRRGTGAYVHAAAFVDSRNRIEVGWLCLRQREARRFYVRNLAEHYALAFGGRVVRIKQVER